jgi:hypothetical protein
MRGSRECRLLAISLWTACAWSLAAADIDALGRECDAGNQAGCAGLTEIAISRDSVEVRQAAIAKLNDPKALLQIARDGRRPAVRLAAVLKLSDAGALREIVNDDRCADGFNSCPVRFDWHLRDAADARLQAVAPPGVEAAEKLADQTAIEKIAWNDPNPFVRTAAIRKVDNQERLRQEYATYQARASWDRYFEMENSAARARIAELALPQIDRLAAQCQAGSREACDQLGTIGKTDIDEVRRLAIGRIADQAMLVEIARGTGSLRGCRGDNSLCVAAVERLTDPAALADLALHHDQWQVSAAALQRVTDPAVLAKAAGPGRPDANQKAAMERITDLAALAELAHNVNGYIVESANARRLALIEQLGQQCGGGNRQACESLLALALTSDRDWDGVGQAAVSKISNPAMLAKVAVLDCKEHPRTKEAAVRKITDQAILARVAAESGCHASHAAIERLTDQALLAKYALGDGIDAARAAVRALTDQAVLARAAGRSRYDEVRAEAAAKLTDPVVLAKVAETDSALEVRSAAFANLREQDALAVLSKTLSHWVAVQKRSNPVELMRTAKTDSTWIMRLAALDMITDQRALTEVATGADYKDVRLAATARLPQSALARLIAGERWDPREAAAVWLTDQAVLAKVAAHNSDTEARLAAIANLTDQTALAEIAMRDEDARLREAAAARLTDQAALAKVAAHDSDQDVQWAAIANLTDQTALAEVAMKEGADLGEAAATKLSSQPELAAVAASGRSSFVQAAAFVRLNDQAAFARVAMTANDSQLADAAVAKLTNQRLLSEVATNARSGGRTRAILRLTDPRVLTKLANPPRPPRAPDMIVVPEGEASASTAASRLRELDRLAENAGPLFPSEKDATTPAGQATLARIATDEDAGLPLRWQAMVRLRDQPALAQAVPLALDVARDDTLPLKVFIERLTDQNALSQIVRSGRPCCLLLEPAVAKLTDTAALTKLALDSNPWEVRLLAVDNLSDQNAVAQIARDRYRSPVGRAAFDKLTDQAALAQFACCHKDEGLRRIAMARLTDQLELVNVAVFVKDPDERKRAVTRLTEDAALARVAASDLQDSKTIDAAVAKLKNQSLLAEIATPTNWYISAGAVAGLTNQPLLAKIARTAHEIEARAVATAKLTDQALLADVALAAKDWTVLTAVFVKLNDRATLSRIAESAPGSPAGQAAKLKLRFLNGAN